MIYSKPIIQSIKEPFLSAYAQSGGNIAGLEFDPANPASCIKVLVDGIPDGNYTVSIAANWENQGDNDCSGQLTYNGPVSIVDSVMSVNCANIDPCNACIGDIWEDTTVCATELVVDGERVEDLPYCITDDEIGAYILNAIQEFDWPSCG